MTEGECYIELVQALCIMVYWKSPTDNTAFLKVGHAVRLGFQLNLHIFNRLPDSADDLLAKRMIVGLDISLQGDKRFI